jgi:hypothetical protein
MNVTNTVGLFVVVWLVAQMPQTTDKSWITNWLHNSKLQKNENFYPLSSVFQPHCKVSFMEVHTQSFSLVGGGGEADPEDIYIYI